MTILFHCLYFGQGWYYACHTLAGTLDLCVVSPPETDKEPLAYLTIKPVTYQTNVTTNIHCVIK